MDTLSEHVADKLVATFEPFSSIQPTDLEFLYQAMSVSNNLLQRTSITTLAYVSGEVLPLMRDVKSPLDAGTKEISKAVRRSDDDSGFSIRSLLAHERLDSVRKRVRKIAIDAV
jgi:hypothetical protein